MDGCEPANSDGNADERRHEMSVVYNEVRVVGFRRASDNELRA